MKRIVMVIMVLLVAAGMAMAFDMTVGFGGIIPESGLMVKVHPIDNFYLTASAHWLGSWFFSTGYNYPMVNNKNFEIFGGAFIGSSFISNSNMTTAAEGEYFLVNTAGAGVEAGISNTFDYGLSLTAGVAGGYKFGEKKPIYWELEPTGRVLLDGIFGIGYRFSF